MAPTEPGLSLEEATQKLFEQEERRTRLLEQVARKEARKEARRLRKARELTSLEASESPSNPSASLTFEPEHPQTAINESIVPQDATIHAQHESKIHHPKSNLSDIDSNNTNSSKTLPFAKSKRVTFDSDEDNVPQARQESNSTPTYHADFATDTDTPDQDAKPTLEGTDGDMVLSPISLLSERLVWPTLVALLIAASVAHITLHSRAFMLCGAAMLTVTSCCAIQRLGLHRLLIFGIVTTLLIVSPPYTSNSQDHFLDGVLFKSPVTISDLVHMYTMNHTLLRGAGQLVIDTNGTACESLNFACLYLPPVLDSTEPLGPPFDGRVEEMWEHCVSKHNVSDCRADGLSWEDHSMDYNEEYEQLVDLFKRTGFKLADGVSKVETLISSLHDGLYDFETRYRLYWISFTDFLRLAAGLPNSTIASSENPSLAWTSSTIRQCSGLARAQTPPGSISAHTHKILSYWSPPSASIASLTSSYHALLHSWALLLQSELTLIGAILETGDECAKEYSGWRELAKDGNGLALDVDGNNWLKNGETRCEGLRGKRPKLYPEFRQLEQNIEVVQIRVIQSMKEVERVMDNQQTSLWKLLPASWFSVDLTAYQKALIEEMLRSGRAQGLRFEKSSLSQMKQLLHDIRTPYTLSRNEIGF